MLRGLSRGAEQDVVSVLAARDLEQLVVSVNAGDVEQPVVALNKACLVQRRHSLFSAGATCSAPAQLVQRRHSLFSAGTACSAPLQPLQWVFNAAAVRQVRCSALPQVVQRGAGFGGAEEFSGR
jgi:hypothetical protein